MKRNFLGLAAIPMLALLATSCAQETVETKGGDNVLNYGVATGKQVLSRATETNADNLTGFGVGAYYTVAGGFFKNFAVTKSGDDWVYVGTEYHPALGLTHYATAPAQTYGTADGASAQFSFAADGNTDLIAAAATTTNESQDKATANLTFNHLLSQITFKVTAPVGFEVAIKDNAISVNNVANFANTYTLNSGNDGSWANYVKTPETPRHTTPFNYSLVASTTVGVAFEGAANSGLMFMPQNLEADVADGNITFEYTLTKDGVVIGEGEDVPATVAFGKFGTIWEAGKRYVYTINFLGPNQIIYTVEDVNVWEPVNGTTVDVGGPTTEPEEPEEPVEP